MFNCHEVSSWLLLLTFFCSLIFSNRKKTDKKKKIPLSFMISLLSIQVILQILSSDTSFWHWPLKKNIWGSHFMSLGCIRLVKLFWYYIFHVYSKIPNMVFQFWPQFVIFLTCNDKKTCFQYQRSWNRIWKY